MFLHVYAYEPDDHNRSEVVMDRSGRIPFSKSDNAEGHSIKDHHEDHNIVQKRSTSISRFLQKRKDLNKIFVKIDAEGAEKQILRDLFKNTGCPMEGIVEFPPEKMDGHVNNLIVYLDTHSGELRKLSSEKKAYDKTNGDDGTVQRPMFYFKR